MTRFCHFQNPTFFHYNVAPSQFFKLFFSSSSHELMVPVFLNSLSKPCSAGLCVTLVLELRHRPKAPA